MCSTKIFNPLQSSGTMPQRMGIGHKRPVQFKGHELGSHWTGTELNPPSPKPHPNITGLSDFLVVSGTALVVSGTPDVTQKWQKHVHPLACSHHFWAMSGITPDMTVLPGSDKGMLGTHLHYFWVMWVFQDGAWHRPEMAQAPNTIAQTMQVWGLLERRDSSQAETHKPGLWLGFRSGPIPTCHHKWLVWMFPISFDATGCLSI